MIVSRVTVTTLEVLGCLPMVGSAVSLPDRSATDRIGGGDAGENSVSSRSGRFRAGLVGDRSALHRRARTG